MGASLTLHAPVKAQSVSFDGRLGDAGAETPHPVTAFSVEGTPGDSCILGLEKLAGPVDLVVSGINSGSNLGWDVVVSGTVGAALQGYLRGYPTIAISVGSVQNPQFGGAASLLRLIGERLSRQKLEQPAAHAEGREPFFLNVNVPSLALAQITGLQVTRPGGRSYGESVREEGLGNQKRYWISRNRPVMADNGEGTDMWAVKNNRISVTPLHLNLGHPEQVPMIESLLADVPAQLLGRGD